MGILEADNHGEAAEGGSSQERLLPASAAGAGTETDRGGEDVVEDRAHVNTAQSHEQEAADEDENLYGGPDIFGTESFDSVCGVDILDASYRPDVRRVLILWGLVLFVVTARLLVGFFGSFRYLLSSGSLDLSFNVWKEELFWTSVVEFVLTCGAATCGFLALINHTRLGSHCKVQSFQQFFTWCLLLHAVSGIFCLVVAIKLTTINLFSPISSSVFTYVPPLIDSRLQGAPPSSPGLRISLNPHLIAGSPTSSALSDSGAEFIAAKEHRSLSSPGATSSSSVPTSDEQQNTAEVSSPFFLPTTDQKNSSGTSSRSLFTPSPSTILQNAEQEKIEGGLSFFQKEETREDVLQAGAHTHSAPSAVPGFVRDERLRGHEESVLPFLPPSDPKIVSLSPSSSHQHPHSLDYQKHRNTPLFSNPPFLSKSFLSKQATFYALFRPSSRTSFSQRHWQRKDHKEHLTTEARPAGALSLPSSSSSSSSSLLHVGSAELHSLPPARPPSQPGDPTSGLLRSSFSSSSSSAGEAPFSSSQAASDVSLPRVTINTRGLQETGFSSGFSSSGLKPESEDLLDSEGFLSQSTSLSSPLDTEEIEDPKTSFRFSSLSKAVENGGVTLSPASATGDSPRNLLLHENQDKRRLHRGFPPLVSAFTDRPASSVYPDDSLSLEESQEDTSGKTLSKTLFPSKATVPIERAEREESPAKPDGSPPPPFSDISASPSLSSSSLSLVDPKELGATSRSPSDLPGETRVPLPGSGAQPAREETNEREEERAERKGEGEEVRTGLKTRRSRLFDEEPEKQPLDTPQSPLSNERGAAEEGEEREREERTFPQSSESPSSSAGLIGGKTSTTGTPASASPSVQGSGVEEEEEEKGWTSPRNLVASSSPRPRGDDEEDRKEEEEQRRGKVSEASSSAPPSSSSRRPMESPLYRRMLYTSIPLDYSAALLHALCFLTSWRLAEVLGKLFGLKMPRIPF